MRLALAQINTWVGDFAGNAERVFDCVRRAREEGADLVVFPELTLPGYPPKDFLEITEFLVEQRRHVDLLARRLPPECAVLLGFVETYLTREAIGRWNAAAWIHGGEVRAVAKKGLLPNYDVFDEQRYFDDSRDRLVMDWLGLKFGVTICEDVWNDAEYWKTRRYAVDPVVELCAAGVQWIINLSASPYAVAKPRMRAEMLRSAARRHGVGIALCNLVGGNDQLVFDGHSLIVDGRGESVAMLSGFREEVAAFDLEGNRFHPVGVVHRPSTSSPAAPISLPAAPDPGALAPPRSGEGAAPPRVARDHDAAEMLDALVLGLSDYMRKTGFDKAVIGLSGGIDSALVAAIAARAVDPSRVLGVAMPSRFTLDMSNQDAAVLAQNLGIGFETVAIESTVEQFRATLRDRFEPTGLTDENLQARVRGVILMSISNQRGHLVLSTGNKSELSVGYCTLYGDMAGGLSVIGDVPKMWVYRLARHVNALKEIIPWRTIDRPPSAELRENQKDEDNLPPYADLDRVLEKMIEGRSFGSDLVRAGERRELIERVQALLLRAEYKRQQAAPTLRVTARAFGDGWRFPIAHRWRPQVREQ